MKYSSKLAALLIATAYMAFILTYPVADASYFLLGWVLAILAFGLILAASLRIRRDFGLSRPLVKVALPMAGLFLLMLLAAAVLQPDELVIGEDTIMHGGSLTAQGWLLAVRDGLLISVGALFYYGVQLLGKGAN